MFTGLVQHLGEVAKMSRESNGGARLAVLAPGFVDGLKLAKASSMAFV